MKKTQPVLIGDFLHRIRRSVKLIDSDKYKLVTIKMNHKGVVLREEKLASNIKSKMYEVKEGDFILSGIDARNGAFGIVPKELDGAIVTNDFWYFDIDESIVDKQLFLELTSTKWFDEICRKGSDGTTQRIRLQKNKFFNQKINIPPIEEQSTFISQFRRNKQNNSNLKQEITHQQTLLKKLRQQILQEAIEGKLTAGWRTKNSPPSEGWQAQPDGVVLNEQQPNKTPRNAKNFHRLPYNPKLKQRARELRKAGNLSEVLLWNQIKRNKLKGLDFDRQKIIGNYIVDFYCPNCQAVIEIDGSSHDDKQEYDAKRDRYLKGLGLAVIHIADSDVKKNLEGVMQWLEGHSALVEGTTPSSLRDATPPKEGNAAVLLERIRVEKERLVKAGEIKKQKPLPPIRDDEKPFELPEGWEWCRVSDLAHLKSGNQYRYTLSNGGIMYIKISDMNLAENKSEITVSSTYFEADQVKKSDLILLNSIIFPKRGGAIATNKRRIVLNKKLLVDSNTMAITPSNLINFYYFKLWFDGVNLSLLGNDSVVPQVNNKDINPLLIPLPPLSEQQAIVAKVGKLLAVCDQLETQITENQTHAKALMQAVLKEAFSHSNEPPA